MPPPLTPQSLKRKLQQSLTEDRTNDNDNDNRDMIINISSSSSITTASSDISLHRSPPTELFLPTDHQMRSSPLRMTLQASPTRCNITNCSSTKSSSMTPFQLVQLAKFFASRPAPFPLELLKPTVLTDFFLKDHALERYFQRRHEEISHDLGLRPLQRPFVRSSPPSVSFSVYLERLVRYCHPEPLHLIAIVAYSERLIKVHKMFVPLPGLHRFAVAAWIVAGKALLGDQFWTNHYWARVAGISVTEICALENELIVLLDWHLQVTLEELTAAWYMLQLL